MASIKQFFIPPDFNLAAAWFVDAALPMALQQYQNIREIAIEPEDRRLLRSLRDRRLLFFTNHPSQAEPLIAYHVANVMGSRFRYMATRRAFDFLFGAVGKLFSGIGAYSVLPGVPDRESMRMTRQILAAAGGKLVIFPEGEPMCGENDSLMPFQAGFLKLSFAALADARKNEPNADITILPGFIKYVIQTPRPEILKHLEHSIAAIEQKLGADPGGRNLLRRFLMVGRLLLEDFEKRYHIEVRPETDFTYRVGRLRHRILDNVARSMNLKHYDKEADAIHKLRHLTSIIELLEVGYEAPDLPQLSHAALQEANRECVKAYDFIVIKPEYLISRPTPERFYEWLQRFESLALGKTPRALGGEPHPLPRTARLSLAQPMSLGEHYEAYRADKNAAVEALNGKIRAQMEGMLERAQALSEPIVAPNDVGETDGHL
ncbi:MAG: 1-acyl-sn-glycerol-3-phosphate acyltransferase [Leptospirales bacterium]|nr:1-acyl-sn-glycerol-3-phosphate acyltransferase [Leptospirales bacterium]